MAVNHDEALKEVKAVEATLWKGSCRSEIIRAADKALKYSHTEVGEHPPENEIAVLRLYRGLAQKARDTALDRKGLLMRAGTDRFSNPVGEMNGAFLRASQAVKTLDKKIEAAEKIIELKRTSNERM